VNNTNIINLAKQNKTKKKEVTMKLTIALLLAAILLCTISCTQKNPVLKLLTEDYPPLTYESNGSVTGYGAELVKAIQAELKSTDKIEMMGWEEAYNTALNEPNVVIFTMEKTPDRDTLFYWLGPIGNNKTYFYIKADSKLKINSLDEAKTVKYIATTTDWFSEKYLQENGFSNLKSNVLPTDGVKLIMTGDADMGVFTDLTVNQIVQQAGFEPGALVPGFEILDTDLYIGISKQTSPKIVEKWNKAFETVKNAGTMEKLREEFLK